MRFPAAARRLSALLQRLRPGSRARRLVIARAIKRAYAAANRRDFELILARNDPQRYEYRPSPDLLPPDMETVYRGHDGYRRFWRLWLDAFEDIRWDPEEILDFGDKLARHHPPERARIGERNRGQRTGVSAVHVQPRAGDQPGGLPGSDEGFAGGRSHPVVAVQQVPDLLRAPAGRGRRCRRTGSGRCRARADRGCTPDRGRGRRPETRARPAAWRGGESARGAGRC